MSRQKRKVRAASAANPAMKTGFLAIGLDGGQRPDIVVTDIGSYSDVVFGLLQLLGPSTARR